MNWLLSRVEPFRTQPDGPKVTDGELVVYILCVLVTTLGLAGDIARHLLNPASLLNNDFISGWHLVLYGGVASVGAFIGMGAVRRGPAYVGSVSTALIGFLLLSFGGVADAGWHAAFGTEAAVEALVSPPHLIVFAGLCFLLTAPVVIVWDRPVRQIGLVPSLAVLVAVVSTVLVASLFTGFVSPMSGGLALQSYPEPLVGASSQDYDVVRGLGIAVWTSAMVAAAFAVVLVRFRMVPGMVLLGFVLLGLPPLIVSDTNQVYPLTVGFIVAGALAEVAVAALGRPRLGRVGASVVGALMGGGLWAGSFAALGADGRLTWSHELWAGTITLSAFVGAATAALVALPVWSAPRHLIRAAGGRPVDSGR